MRGLSHDPEWTALLLGFLVAGVGIGLVNPPLASTAVGVVTRAAHGMASGINNTFRQVGIATGIAGLGAIFQSIVEDKVREGFAALAGGRAGTLAHLVANQDTAQALAQIPARARGQAAAIVNSAFVDALNVLLLIGAGTGVRRRAVHVLARPDERLRHRALRRAARRLRQPADKKGIPGEPFD